MSAEETKALKSEETINIPKTVLSKIGRNLHKKARHPIQLIKQKIENHFNSAAPTTTVISTKPKYATFDSLSPMVSIADNFDLLLIPADHPSRSLSDTYYVTKDTVLRTQTSAHQNELLKRGVTKFLVTGDVYRKDEADATHYPVFHQMEGMHVFDDEELKSPEIKVIGEKKFPVRDEDEKVVATQYDGAIGLARCHLLLTLSGLVEHLFPGCEYRFGVDKFPFTHPSYEVDVKFNDKWVEILGCGLVRPEILAHCGHGGKVAWAFGLGLERLAMILFQIPHIKYFWSEDEKFLSQWATKDDAKFVPYSPLEPVTKDISFWLPAAGEFKENNFYDLVRELSDDMVSDVKRIDMFTHPKTGQTSHAYRLTFLPTDPSMLNGGDFAKRVLDVFRVVYSAVGERLGVKLR